MDGYVSDGVVLVVFGALKVAMALVSMHPPTFVPTWWIPDDVSLQARVLEACLLAFGIFSLLRGLTLLGVLSWAKDAGVPRGAGTAFVVLLGLFMIVYFGVSAALAGAYRGARMELLGVAGGFSILASAAYAQRRWTVAAGLTAASMAFAADALRRMWQLGTTPSATVGLDLASLTILAVFNAT